ncbi:MAG: uroporphyrinogen decarboxylase family protein [Kiritimatiellae bacterium]|nr:uroporphyrinogen decarboxylase family protein [Kiritimatiellia bacterium]
MTPRERVIAALNHQRPDRLPRYDIFFQSFIDSWRQAKGRPADADIYSDYRLDIPRILANQSGPFWRQVHTQETGGDVYYTRDTWGRLHRRLHSAALSEVLATAFDDKTVVDRVDFADPNTMEEKEDDRLNFDKLLNDPRFAPVTGVMGLYHACTWLRGDVPFMMDLADDDAFCHALIAKTAAFLAALGERMLARTNTYDTAIWVYDDFCVGKGPMISPAIFEKFFLQPYKRMFARWKTSGVRHIVAHIDIMAKACYPIVDMFLDAGLTGIQGVYPTAGLTLPEFKAHYGRKLSVVGGMCNTRTLPFGTRAEIEREATAIREIGQDGGVIIGSHSIEGYIPVSNYDAYWAALDR